MRELYSALIGAGWCTRAEFWQMSPRECWWLIAAKNPHPVINDCEELYQLLKNNGFEHV